jgi:murein DD-endopeptidase MepM/ murein hydrolase activator NlpD
MADGVVVIASASWPPAVTYLEPVWASPGAYGAYVQVWHEALGFSTGYAHLSGLSARPKQALLAGGALGQSGESGITFGAHVHVMALRDARPFDFADLLVVG